jgi:hypothetical protein
MDRSIKLYINGQLYQHPWLDYESKGCGLEPDLSKFRIESGDGKFVYIPYGLMIFTPQDATLKKHEVEIGANNAFIENCFADHQLLVLRQRSIWVVDLISNSLVEKIYPFELLQFEKMWRDQGVIRFLYKDKKTLISGIIEYNLQNKTFNNDVV